MKITALYDTKGVILAAIELVDGVSSPIPVPFVGEKVETFEVPSTASKLRLDDICTRFRVDTDKQCLTMAPPSSSEDHTAKA